MNKTNKSRLLVSHVSGRVRMVRWAGCLVVKSDTSGTEKGNMGHVNFLTRPSLDYDSYVTQEDPYVVHSVRSGDQAICVLSSTVELRRFESDSNHEVENTIKIDPPKQVITDPTQGIYIRGGNAITKVYLKSSFEDKKIESFAISGTYESMSARLGLLAAIRKGNGSSRDPCEISLRSYTAEGVLIKNLAFKVDLVQNVEQYLPESILDDAELVKQKAGLRSKLPKKMEMPEPGANPPKKFQSSKGPCVNSLSICIAGHGLLVACLYGKGEKNGVTLYYIKLYAAKAPESWELIDGKDITPPGTTNLKAETLAAFLKSRCTLFEQRDTPACIFWHPTNPESYSLYAFRHGRFMTMVEWGKDPYYIRYLKQGLKCLVPRTEFDYKTNKIIILIQRDHPDKTRSAVFSRIRFTF